MHWAKRDRCERAQKKKKPPRAWHPPLGKPGQSISSDHTVSIPTLQPPWTKFSLTGTWITWGLFVATYISDGVYPGKSSTKSYRCETSRLAPRINSYYPVSHPTRKTFVQRSKSNIDCCPTTGNKWSLKGNSGVSLPIRMLLTHSCYVLPSLLVICAKSPSRAMFSCGANEF